MGPTFYSALAAGMLQDLSSPLQCDQQDYYAPYSAMENGPMLEKAMDIFLSLAWERPTPFKMTWQSMFDDSSQDLLPDWTISQLAVAIAAEIAAERYRETTLMLLAHLRETMPSDTTTDPQTHHLRTWLHEMYPDRVSTVQPRYRGSRGKRAALTWERRKEIATRRHRKYALVSSPALTYRRRRDPHEHEAMVDALMLPLPVGNRSLRVVDVLANLVASTLSTSDLTTAPQTALQIASQEQSVMERAYAPPTVLPKNIVRVHLLHDFSGVSFQDAKLKVVIMGQLRPFRPFPDIQAALKSYASDVRLTAASLSRENWGPDETVDRLKTLKSERSFGEKYADARERVQMRMDKIPLHYAGVRTEGAASRDMAFGNGGLWIRR